jgi:hypothetical protein
MKVVNNFFAYKWGHNGKSDFLYTEAVPIALNEVLMCINLIKY